MKKRKILGVMITQANDDLYFHVPRTLSKVPTDIKWSFVVLGIPARMRKDYTKPNFGYDTDRIHLPTGFVQYEELIHHCDAVLVGCGAGSVTAPLVLDKPVFLQSVEGGDDSMQNKDNLANLFNNPRFGLQEMLRRDPHEIKFRYYPLEKKEPGIITISDHPDIINDAVVNNLDLTFLSSFLARRLSSPFFDKYKKAFTEVSLKIQKRVNNELKKMPVRFMGVVNGTNCQKCTHRKRKFPFE